MDQSEVLNLWAGIGTLTYNMVCVSKSHAILWPVIHVKLNVGKKLTGLEIMALNLKKI